MSAYRPPSDAGITIRDRRELPFFQGRLRSVQAIRNETTGPRRLRAIGFYALLCQLANEQRHTGEHRVVRATYDTLAARGQMSKRTVKLLLDALEQANVVRYERLADRSTGAVISLFHLLILDEPWIALTVATADGLATPTRPRSAVETTAIENNPPSRGKGAVAAEGGAGRVSAAEQLCDALVASWAPALGDSPRRQYQGNRQGWLAAAEKLLQRHPRERLDSAFAYMVTDEILGSEALTMPGFAKVADKLIARAHARRLRFSARASGGVAARGLSWQDAKVAIERAIRRHGRDGRAAALAELSAENPLLPRFVDRVKWSALCEQPLRYAERRYAETWAAVTDENTNGREDATA